MQKSHFVLLENNIDNLEEEEKLLRHITTFFEPTIEVEANLRRLKNTKKKNSAVNLS